ncbi:ATP-binding protein [Paludibacterium yongneupense]|uniref:ATP-binding protein n=1 Tax=Paludibacterium yongneupense TaxID=400061 RepID=UPI0004133E90|nr:ATP-binding protein [Paludibacterium yongneupense]
MKFPIALRLFCTVLLTCMLVAACGLWMVQTRLEQGFAGYVTEVELSRLDAMVNRLQGVYSARHDWSAIPPAARTNWLPSQFMRMLIDSGGIPPDEPAAAGLPWPVKPKPFSPPPIPMPMDRLALHVRASLLDADGHYLSGAQTTADDPRRALRVDGKVVGYLVLRRQADPRDVLVQTFLREQSRELLLIGLACIALSALAAAILATQFRAPIQRLVGAARQLTEGHFDTRIASRRSDELGELAHAFDRLAGMLEQHEAMRRQWIADTSHELRTPLAVLRAQVEALQDGIRLAGPEQFAAMHRQILTLSKLVEDLNALASADVGQLVLRATLLDPWELAVAEAQASSDRFARQQLKLEWQDPAQRPLVMADADRLRQVCANLLENSLRYTHPGGSVRLSAFSGEQHWTLVVEDSAPKVPEEALPHLTERFFRVESSRSRALGGSGLGLSVCERIALAHGGGLRFGASELGGLRVEFFIDRRPS